MGRRVIPQRERNEINLGEITHVCICGSEWWNVQVKFDDYEIAVYMTEMSCSNCGAVAIAPTPIDRPEEE